jgi:hypothetical protein
MQRYSQQGPPGKVEGEHTKAAEGALDALPLLRELASRIAELLIDATDDNSREPGG